MSDDVPNIIANTILYRFVPEDNGKVALRNYMDEVVIRFPTQESAMPFVLAYTNMLGQSPQRANDYIAGVLEGISLYHTHLISVGAMRPLTEWGTLDGN